MINQDLFRIFYSWIDDEGNNLEDGEYHTTYVMASCASGAKDLVVDYMMQSFPDYSIKVVDCVFIPCVDVMRKTKTGSFVIYEDDEYGVQFAKMGSF